MLVRILFVLGAGTLSLLGGCRSASSPATIPAAATVATADLRNTRWVLRLLHNRAITTPEQGEVYVLLRSEELRAEGFGGCNRFRGSFSLPADGQLQFGPLLSTRMACADPAGTATETGFLAALAATRTYRISGDTLRLYEPAAQTPLAVLHAVYLH